MCQVAEFMDHHIVEHRRGRQDQPPVEIQYPSGRTTAPSRFLSLDANAPGLEAHHPLEKPEWVTLFKKTFVFTGGEITGEFLMSTGYLPGAHDEDCPVFARVARLDPPDQMMFDCI